MTVCIECGAALNVPEDVMQGEIIDCPGCGVELEVTNPVTRELRVAETEGEDWGE